MTTSKWSRPDHSTRRPLVRPRWVWGGLAVALAGLGVLGLGIALLSLWCSITGAALLVLGAASSVAGGIMYDASPELSAGTEMRQIVRGDVHEAVSTRESVREPNARLHAAQTTARTDALLRARPTTSRPLAPIAGWSLLGITTFVVVSQPWFLAHSANGHDSALRDTGLVILSGLAGIRIATGVGRHLMAVALATLAGLGLLLGGLFAQHDRTDLVIVETTCGVITIVLALAGGARPTPASYNDVNPGPPDRDG
ncbi:hypothetical protein FB382_001588 [Nocardioides ginsengisegetis]|uniref:Uncharacterized protein n=1 Tax=Nocardioides ginsengisegetis TaxID=661491 RepID=A0A7W3IZ48_9ACTN|nr:hypothetical protein [Nocardioides ginsengisegetis]MBA8803297.1 hypothetical protein [Nocardioides ginsengisegetis]